MGLIGRPNCAVKNSQLAFALESEGGALVPEGSSTPAPRMTSSAGNILRLRGLPYSATAADITDTFFEGYETVAVYLGLKNGKSGLQSCDVLRRCALRRL